MQKTYIILGRTGDILNLLPVIEYEAQQNKYKPRLVVAKEYADVLEGVDYVERVIYNGEFQDILGAITYATARHPDDQIINCAVYGKNYSYKKKCASFLREAWNFAQAPVAWGSLPLNINRRSPEREKKLLEDIGYFDSDAPLIVASLNGHSSPFPHREILIRKIANELVMGKLKDFRFIDISGVRAERIYDLLALYERAHCLIASDSAPLHLAEAMPSLPPELPIISLISDLKDHWHQSSWRKKHILRLLYSEVPNNLDEIIKAIEQGFTYERPSIRLVTSAPNSFNDETKRRNSLALASWIKERNIAGAGFWYFDFYNSMTVPKVKTMIDFISDKANTNDILMITNADINFVPGITGWILHEIKRHDAVYFHRHDFFNRMEGNLISEAQVTAGKWYCGSDAFAFSRKWWLENRDIFPDGMYFAREGWDMVMRNMIKRTKGAEIHNAIYHEKHKSFWEAPENKNCRENLINRSLGQQWLNNFGGDWNDWKLKNIIYKK